MSAPVPPSQPESQAPAEPPQPAAPKRRRGPAALLLLAALVLLVGGGIAYHLITAPTITGTWSGKGTFGFGQEKVPFALYLDLKQTDSTHVTGSGAVCVPALSLERSPFTVNGTTSTDLHHIVLTVGGSNTANTLDANLTNNTLNVSFPSADNSFTGSAALTHGTAQQFTQTCAALPTPSVVIGG